MPLFPNNPAPVPKDAAPAAQALQMDLLSKPQSQESLGFSLCTCPEAQTKGSAILSWPQTVTAYSLHCLMVFGNPDSAAAAPTRVCNSALLLPQPLLHQGWRAHFRTEALAEPPGNGQLNTRSSQGFSQWILSLHEALDIYMNFSISGGFKQVTPSYSSSKTLFLLISL